MVTTRRSFASLVGFLSIAFVTVPSLLTGAESAAAPPTSIIQRPPSAIQLPLDLRPSIDRMFQKSETFRAQYRRIVDASSFVVVVQIDPTLREGPFRARSTIRRYTSGLVVALVYIGPGGDQTEWLAHEFEHIVEQLDGWDLPLMARGRTNGVWYSGRGAIETHRATRAGRTVLNEVRRRVVRSDKLVE